MWLFTVDGFYSVVADSEDPGRVWIRGRHLGDIRTARERLAALGTQVEIIKTPKADYPYRIGVSRDDFIRWLERQGQAVVYPNFKAEVLRQRGPGDYEELLHMVWALARDVFARAKREGTR